MSNQEKSSIFITTLNSLESAIQHNMAGLKEGVFHEEETCIDAFLKRLNKNRIPIDMNEFFESLKSEICDKYFHGEKDYSKIKEQYLKLHNELQIFTYLTILQNAWRESRLKDIHLHMLFELGYMMAKLYYDQFERPLKEGVQRIADGRRQKIKQYGTDEERTKRDDHIQNVINDMHKQKPKLSHLQLCELAIKKCGVNISPEYVKKKTKNPRTQKS